MDCGQHSSTHGVVDVLRRGPVFSAARGPLCLLQSARLETAVAPRRRKEDPTDRIGDDVVRYGSVQHGFGREVAPALAGLTRVVDGIFAIES